MFCGLGEERTRIRKKKKGTKKKPPRGQIGWMQEYFKTYNNVKYFLPYLSRF